MLRLLISVLILNISSKLFCDAIYFYDDNSILNYQKFKLKRQERFIDTGSPLWVVSLSGDDWLAPKLRLGNTTELEDFMKHAGPVMKKSLLRPPIRVKKDDPERATPNRPQKSNAEIKNGFIQIINKFALSTTLEPDAYIEDNNDHDYNNPIVTLSFKGSYAYLMVELGRYQWICYIDVPSLLPGWFFENHDTHESPILIPEDVKTQLFNTLWFMIHVMFGFGIKE